MGRERVPEELPKARAKAPVATQESEGADHGSLLAGVGGADGGNHVHPTSVLRLQRLAGNTAVGTLVGSQGLAVQRDEDEESGGDDSSSSDDYEPVGETSDDSSSSDDSSTDDSTSDDSTSDDSTTDDSTTDDATTSSGLIVEDDEAPGEGQMTKSAFLALVRSAVVNQVDGASDLLVAPYFLTYQYSDAADVEARIKSEAPAAATANTAADLIPAIVDQVNARVSAADDADSVDTTSDSDDGSSLADTVMGKAKPGESGPSGSAQGTRAQLGGGRPLDASIRSRMGSALGADLSGVRIHTDPTAAALSEREGARAFTVGQDVAFGPGEYQPDTPVGDALLAHELAHVAQQQGGEAAAPQGATDESALEEDADSAAVAAVASRWSIGQDRLASFGQAAGARLRSGLRLQRCSNKQVEGTAEEAEQIKKRLDDADKAVKYASMLIPDDKVARLNQLRGYLQQGSDILGKGLSAKAVTDEMVALATAIHDCEVAQASNDRVAFANAMDRLFVAAGNLMVRVPALATVGKFLQGTGTFFEDVGHSGGGMGPAQDRLDEINRGLPPGEHVGPR